MKQSYSVLLGLCIAVLASFSTRARADIDVEVAGLIGTGVSTDSEVQNNPYALQLGAVGELSIGNYVIGVRGTRSLGNNDKCGTPTVDTPVLTANPRCRDVKDLRTIGGDLGYAWNIAMLHVGPRLGFGHVKERDGTRAAGYIEPGAVAEVSLLMFAVGLDLRYRVAFGKSELNGFLAYLRLGLRF